jgi:hypothetical protein
MCIHPVESHTFTITDNNVKLYKTVKTGCKLAGSFKIISHLKVYISKVKILNCKIKLLK